MIHCQINPRYKTTGSKCALTLLGKYHYISTSHQEKIVHFSQEGERVPLWFSNNTWGADITLISTGLFSHTVKVGFSKLTQGEFAYRVSSAERAILEMLYCAPGKESLDEVKRIFMVLAEMYNHPWLEKLDISGVDFGKGKRSIVKGGYFHHKYNITVPADWKVQDIKRGI